MKRRRLLFSSLLSAAVLAFLPSCDKKESGDNSDAEAKSGGISEADAVASLKEAFGELKALKAKGDAVEEGTDPMALLPMLREMVVKGSSLPAEGLPADLKAGVEKMNALFKNMGDALLPLFEDIPSDEKGIKEWASGLQADPAKAQEIMQSMMELGPKMQALEPERDALKAELTPLFEKHGLPVDFLDE